MEEIELFYNILDIVIANIDNIGSISNFYSNYHYANLGNLATISSDNQYINLIKKIKSKLKYKIKKSRN